MNIFYFLSKYSYISFHYKVKLNADYNYLPLVEQKQQWWPCNKLLDHTIC
jgi:hypothetical protein